MPHINIKSFPAEISGNARTELITKITEVISNIFGCNQDVISIALEPIEPAAWKDQVYQTEIMEKREFLLKTPEY